MTRTEQHPARKFTSGQAPKKIGNSKRYFLWSGPCGIGVPAVSGTWTEDRLGRRADTQGNTDQRDPLEGAGVLVVPNHCATVVQRRRRLRRKKSLARRRGEGLVQSPLEALPTEVLVGILLPLVRTDAIYHFSPIHRAPERLHSVHLLTRDDAPAPPEDDATQSPLAIALVCKRLKDIVYGIFYGQNKFVLEVCGLDDGLTSHVANECALRRVVLE